MHGKATIANSKRDQAGAPHVPRASPTILHTNLYSTAEDQTHLIYKIHCGAHREHPEESGTHDDSQQRYHGANMWKRSAWPQRQRLRLFHHVPDDVRHDGGKDQLISLRDEGQGDCVQEKLCDRCTFRHPHAAEHKEHEDHAQLQQNSQKHPEKLPNGYRENLNIPQVNLKPRPCIVPPPLCDIRQRYGHIEETRGVLYHGPRPQRNDHASEEWAPRKSKDCLLEVPPGLVHEFHLQVAGWTESSQLKVHRQLRSPKLELP